MKTTHEYGSAQHWAQVLDSEFPKESDRAAVVLVASLFDNALAQLLRISLVASPTAQDDLLDGANSPLSTFSARINAAFRLGLISRRFCRDLHLVRQIRNRFAHNVIGCTFEETSVRSQILELAKSSAVIEKNPIMRKKKFPKGPRGDFVMCASWMLWSLNSSIERAECFAEADSEMGYHDFASEPEKKPRKKRSTSKSV